MSSSSKQISLKVLIHKQEERVVFAEADSDFVDILFSFLTMPMGTIVRLLSKQSQPPAIGSFNNLYKSIANLDSKYFASEEWKEMLLNTRNSAEAECQKLKINIDDTKPIAQYFICRGNCETYYSISSSFKCTKCLRFFNKMVPLSAKNSSLTTANGVFVSPTASFVITDDLNIIPNNPTSLFEILRSSGVADFGLLEEKIFTIGPTQVVQFLKDSFLSNTRLTSMFLGKNLDVKNAIQTVNHQTIAEFGDSFKKMTVKVLVQKSSNKILLAYCSEDFINFLFNFATIPLGRAICLSKDLTPTRGVDNIHQSVSNLHDGKYFHSQRMKYMLLCPKMAMFHHTSNRLFPREEQINFFYLTRRWSSDVECVNSLSTDSSSGSHKLKLVSTTDKGFLRGSIEFMVTDDLVVTPLSTMACIKYLQRWEISPGDTEEKVIDIGIEEGVSLLRASLVSDSVLTDGLKHLIETKPHTEGLLLKIPKNEK